MTSTTLDSVRRHRESLGDAYNRRDLDAILNDYAENPLFIDYAQQLTLTSTDEIRAYVLAQWASSSHDEVTDLEVTGTDEWTVARFVNSGINDGPFGDLEPSGRPFKVNLCNIVRWRDGKAVEDYLYYDLYGLLAQLGHAPPLSQTR